MGRIKGLSAADLEAWSAYGQTVPRHMPGRTRLPVEPKPPIPLLQERPKAPPVKLARGSAAGLDKSTWKKFSTGKIQALRRLDLHGHTAARAHHAVLAFVEHAYAEQARCIEIITGKGEILARELPHWLNAPPLRPIILAMAHPHTANTGSVRILLRRIRA